jgi:hypothetical protein
MSSATGADHQRSHNKPQVKKIIDEYISYTNDIYDVFPKYYDKSFLPVRKGACKDFVFFKYSTYDWKSDVNKKEDLEFEEQFSSSFSEELEFKYLLLKEIELQFENC